VVEDAAHALPAKYNGSMVGVMGDITCFSFYATKTIATGEGGMATTQNEAWAQRMRMMSLHGISHDAWKRYTKEGSWYYEVISPGYKYNLTDVAAALGIEQLKKSDRFWQARKAIAAEYDKAFADLPQVQTPAHRKNVQHAWHLYVLKLNPSALTIDRNQFVEALRERQIGASVHFIPLHMHPYYRDQMGYRKEDFPVATSVFETILSIPIYPKMSPDQVTRVIEAVRDIAVRHRR
jgi:perosamine synthetase